MLHALKSGAFNLAIGSRYVAGGGVGNWNVTRQGCSRLATRIGQILMRGRKVADPMSGFFMIERQLFLQTVDKLSGKGYKILLDIFASTGYLYRADLPWWLSGLLGALIGGVWNYAVSYTLVWKRR